MGLLYKFRLVTPFSTGHTRLNRVTRTIINVAVLFGIWALTGLLVDIGDKIPAIGQYVISIVFAFVFARILCLFMELIMANRKSCALMVV